jgi:glycosyltransferase involved in cell wall biosynthesis
LEDANARLFLAGSLLGEISDQANSIIKKDNRIRFLGWQSPDDLRALLCAADVYVQPGTQSATMQMSLCARCAVILDDVPSHVPYVDTNGWLISESVTLQEALGSAMLDPEKLHSMNSRSHAIALKFLDYRVLAARICH